MEPIYGRDSGSPPGDAGAVLGMDNIALRLPLAGAASRALAAAIDYLLLMIIFGILAFVIVFGLGSLNLSAGWLVGIVLLCYFICHWGYFAIAEITTEGRTPGKEALKLRTIGREGGTPPPSSFVIRNLLRDIDLAIGVFLMALDPQFRRLGDRMAGTVVIHDRPPEPEIVLGRMPSTWGVREARLVEAYLRRADVLAVEVSFRLGNQLVAILAGDEPSFLEGHDADAHPATILQNALEVRRE